MKLILTVLTSLILSAISVMARAQDWPMFMTDAGHSGHASVQASPNVANLELVWHLSLRTPVNASPIVSGDQMLVAGENGNLYAFNLKSRRQVWLYHAEGGIGATPAVVDGRIYVFSRDGVMVALDQITGKRLWRFVTKGEGHYEAVGGYGQPEALGPIPDPWDFHLSSPLVHDGRVYFGSSDKHVYALDAATGAVVWSFTADDMVHSSPAYADGKILIGTWGTRLYALDAATGREDWHFQGGVERKYSILLGITASPTIDKDTVYIGARDGFFYALNLKDGAVRWVYDAGGSWVLSTAAIDDQNVYFATSDTGLFVALNKSSGRETYRFDTKVWTYTSPIIVDHYIVFGTMMGDLYALDRLNGAKVWSFQTPEGQADSEDLIDNNTHRLNTERLFDQRRQLQASIEAVRALGAFTASPIWADGRLITVSADGELRIFQTHDEGAEQ